MIYALEWYDIPRDSYTDLIHFHPYLTNGDDGKLYYITMQHTVENCVSMLLYTIVSNRMLMKRGP